MLFYNMAFSFCTHLRKKKKLFSSILQNFEGRNADKLYNTVAHVSSCQTNQNFRRVKCGLTLEKLCSSLDPLQSRFENNETRNRCGFVLGCLKWTQVDDSIELKSTVPAQAMASGWGHPKSGAAIKPSRVHVCEPGLCSSSISSGNKNQALHLAAAAAVTSWCSLLQFVSSSCEHSCSLLWF